MPHLMMFTVLICCGGYLCYSIVGATDKPIKVEVDGVSFFFMSFVMISGITTSLMRNIPNIANHYIQEIICCAILYVMARSIFKKNRSAVDMLLTTNLLIALVFMGQYWYIKLFTGAAYEFIGFLKTKHFLSIYLIVSVMMSFELKKKNRYLLGFLALLTAVTVVDTGSRISVLSMIATGIAYGMLRRSRPFKIAYAFPIIFVLILVTYMLYQLRPASVQGRFLLWEMGLSGMEWKYVLFGRGFGFIEYYLADLQGDFMANAKLSERLMAGEVKTVLNEYIRVWVETGTVGSVLMGTAVCIALRNFYRERLHGAFSACIAILVCSLASYPFLSPSIQMLCVFLLAFASLSCPNRVFTFSCHYSGTQKRLAVLMVMLCMATLFFRHAQYVSDLMKWRDLSDLPHQTSEYAFITGYRKLNKTLHGEVKFLHDYAVRLQSLDDYQAADTVLQRLVSMQPNYARYLILGYNYEALEQYDLAASCYRKAENILPKAFIPKYMLFDLYRMTNDRSKAIAMAKHILNHPVKIKREDVSQIKQEAIHYLHNINTKSYENKSNAN